MKKVKYFWISFGVVIGLILLTSTGIYTYSQITKPKCGDKIPGQIDVVASKHDNPVDFSPEINVVMRSMGEPEVPAGSGYGWYKVYITKGKENEAITKLEAKLSDKAVVFQSTVSCVGPSGNSI
jgi:hypothetical protein